MLGSGCICTLYYSSCQYVSNSYLTFTDGYPLMIAGYGASLDFVLVFISTTIIWNLKLSISRRIQLAALLGTGIL